MKVYKAHEKPKCKVGDTVYMVRAEDPWPVEAECYRIDKIVEQKKIGAEIVQCAPYWRYYLRTKANDYENIAGAFIYRDEETALTAVLAYERSKQRMAVATENACADRIALVEKERTRVLTEKELTRCQKHR